MVYKSCATPSLTLTSTTVTTHSIACAETASNTTPIVPGVFVWVSRTYASIDICGRSGGMFFTSSNNDCKGLFLNNIASIFCVWKVICSVNDTMTVSSTSLTAHSCVFQVIRDCHFKLKTINYCIRCYSQIGTG